MSRLSLFFLLILTLAVCFSRDQQISPVPVFTKYQAADKIYRDAIRLSDQAGDNEALQEKADRLFLQALQQFSLLLPQAEAALNDSLAFFISSKSGYIHYIFDSTQAALSSYRLAIGLKQKVPAIADSMLFTPLLYTGGIYYEQNKYDSALLFYKKAEEINDRYPHPLSETQRLYNRLGVMFYETGNYRQARNYFEKAIAVAPPAATTLRANYQVNIASLLVKLDELEKAKDIYTSLLPLNIFNNEINHNLGIISLKQEAYKEAAGYFNKVSYTDKKNIDLFYNRAMAYSGLRQTDSAELYLHKALAENLKWNGYRKNIPYGLLLKYQADELVRKRLYKDALALYQEAIMQFDQQFAEMDINKNPEQFSAVYSYINLFTTLTAKGDALERIYQQENEVPALAASLYAYRSAFKLADHVERTYNSDEARLFLGKIKYAVHSRPIDIGLQLFRLTQKKEYLEEVYFFDQRNKASILSLNVRMRELSSPGPGNDELLRRESAIKSTITRLSLKAAGLADSIQLVQLNAAIRDQEIELDKTREEINADPVRQQLLAAEKIPMISQLHRQLDNSSAILSYHLSESELLILLITANRFEYFQVQLGRDFLTQIESLKTALYYTPSEHRYNGAGPATWLYQQLIAPVQSSIAQLKRLVIIPDDELNYLPFEALQDNNKKYLFEKFAIQYQYSTALLGNNSGRSYSQASILSFAPFAGAGYHDSAFSLSQLPASAEEIKDLSGRVLLDRAATKENFLRYANHNSTIHLATHASVSNEAPLQSYISFYPGNNASRLYAREIYDLRLDTTSLVILSACETGSGQLIKGEGLMSLSRAFAYAGCPNIITSLWKAEDNTTAFITQRLHYYLSRNETKDRALQLARIDLLNNPEIAPSLKTPNYWAHLILIGEYEPDHKRSNWSWVAAGIVIILLTYYFVKRKSLPASKKRQA